MIFTVKDDVDIIVSEGKGTLKKVMNYYYGKEKCILWATYFPRSVNVNVCVDLTKNGKNSFAAEKLKQLSKYVCMYVCVRRFNKMYAY